MIAYVWHSVPGFSKFGSFEGNASANGQSIYLGFQPEIVLYKNTNGTGNWVIYDTARGPYNTNNKRLRVNTNEQEGDVAEVDGFDDPDKVDDGSVKLDEETFDDKDKAGVEDEWYAKLQFTYPPREGATALDGISDTMWKEQKDMTLSLIHI